MPEGYLHLTCEQRCQIYALLKSGHTQSHIARQIGVDASAISRELARNSGATARTPRLYSPTFRRECPKLSGATKRIPAVVAEVGRLNTAYKDKLPQWQATR